MLVRLCKIAMLLGLAVFAFLVTLNNIVDYGSNFAFVQHVLSMDTTFEGNALMGRAITTEWMWHAGYWLIIAGEGLTALLLAGGAVAMFAARHAPAPDFAAAKSWAVLGATTGFMVWFVGFMAIGAEWFLMWQSEIWNGQQPAFRFYISLLAVIIFVTQPEPETR
ncbi:DUF2165 family protein [Limimaricola hongkongensis]|uniref:Small integral membrane protein n=1 Tax=Limimaricola hongkongensis DSM 17492 TaxID=1122180 RepID=A0A017HFT7_9RHOB|nr:DUF2165 domain-containing protein [Limimaricola hongkongensis]EYD73226.1 small integral membrane protein [Limimaricola hongkongensis DSM 17492]